MTKKELLRTLNNVLKKIISQLMEKPKTNKDRLIKNVLFFVYSNFLSWLNNRYALRFGSMVLIFLDLRQVWVPDYVCDCLFLMLLANNKKTDHPLIPIYNPRAKILSNASLLPSNEWTTPPTNLSWLQVRISTKSSVAARQWRNTGRLNSLLSGSWYSKYLKN